MCIRDRFIRERECLEAAVQQAYDARLIGKSNIHGFDFDIVDVYKRQRKS